MIPQRVEPTDDHKAPAVQGTEPDWLERFWQKADRAVERYVGPMILIWTAVYLAWHLWMASFR